MNITGFRSIPILSRNLLNVSKNMISKKDYNKTVKIQYNDLVNKIELFGISKFTKLIKNQTDKFDYDIFNFSESEIVYSVDKKSYKYIEYCEFHDYLQNEKMYIRYKLNINKIIPDKTFDILICEEINKVNLKLFLGDSSQEVNMDFWNNLPIIQQNQLKLIDLMIEKNIDKVKIIE